MILTAIVAGGDGKIFTVDVQREQLGWMFADELRERGRL